MARGQKANVGDKRVAPNGYHYTRTESGWRLTHHLVAEKKLGRPLHTDEGVYFVDGKRHNLSPDNISVREKGRGSLRRRLAQLDDRIRELTAERDAIQKQLLGSFGEEKQ